MYQAEALDYVIYRDTTPGHLSLLPLATKFLIEMLTRFPKEGLDHSINYLFAIFKFQEVKQELLKQTSCTITNGIAIMSHMSLHQQTLLVACATQFLQNYPESAIFLVRIVIEALERDTG